MAPKQPNTGLFVGLNKGHVVTKKELPPRPRDRKGVSVTSLLLSLCCSIGILMLLLIYHLFG